MNNFLCVSVLLCCAICYGFELGSRIGQVEILTLKEAERQEEEEQQLVHVNEVQQQEEEEQLEQQQEEEEQLAQQQEEEEQLAQQQEEEGQLAQLKETQQQEKREAELGQLEEAQQQEKREAELGQLEEAQQQEEEGQSAQLKQEETQQQQQQRENYRGTSREYCHMQVRKCGLYEIQLGRKLPSIAFLSENCGKIIPALTCTVEKLNECISDDLEEVQGVLNLAKRLCDKHDPFRAAYGNSVACLDENQEFITYCFRTVFKTARAFREYILKLDSEELDESKARCMVTMAIQSCLIGNAESKCGEEAAQVTLVVTESLLLSPVDKGSCQVDVAENIKHDLIRYLTVQNYQQNEM